MTKNERELALLFIGKVERRLMVYQAEMQRELDRLRQVLGLKTMKETPR